MFLVKYQVVSDLELMLFHTLATYGTRRENKCLLYERIFI